VIDVWRLVRAHNLLVAAAGVLAGGWIALGAVAAPRELLFAAVAAIGFGAAGNALNDLQDVAADRVNRPGGERPLAAGRLGPDAANLCVFLAVLAGLAAAALAGGRPLLVGLLALALMAGYTPLLKPRGLPGNVTVAVVAGLPLYYGALAVGRPAAGLVPWGLAAWLHLGREVVKDFDDEPGDRVAGRRTLPIRWGRPRAAALAAAILAAFVPASLVFPWAAGYRPVYFAVAAPAQVVALLGAARLLRGGERARTDRVSLALKVAMVIGIVALVLGRPS
jgi:geranylgeranylglycerol-phosphate geranylgeranyltransferase